MTKRRRLGYLGPAIVIVGIVVAVLAVWFLRSVRPEAGAVIDTIAIDARRSIVLREQVGAKNSFIELRDGDHIVWQALIPPYAGTKARRAVAWSDKAVTVRVARDGRAEVFAFAMDRSHKLGTFKLAQDREPITTHAEGPITLTDHTRSYELVGGADWNQLIAVDIVRGGGIWKADLGRDRVTAGGVEAGTVWIEQAGKRRRFDAATGREAASDKPLN